MAKTRASSNLPTEEKMKPIEYWIAVACKFGPEEGWTDSEEYIRDPKNTSFLICGRWFIKRGDMAECVE